MRILGYTQKWAKLRKPIHTTFRFPRKDSDRGRDWAEGEIVQEVYRPRSKEREIIQVAQIIKKEHKLLADITHEEAIEDGFINLYQMFEWLQAHHGGKDMLKPINKLILRIVEYVNV